MSGPGATLLDTIVLSTCACGARRAGLSATLLRRYSCPTVWPRERFIGRAFEEVVVSSRYWMDRLRNEKVASGKAGIQIRRPEELLELALEKREKSQSDIL